MDVLNKDNFSDFIAESCSPLGGLSRELLADEFHVSIAAIDRWIDGISRLPEHSQKNIVARVHQLIEGLDK